MAAQMSTQEIDLHVTDMETFLRCRQLWYWQSPIRMNLQPMSLSAPLFLGQGVHQAADIYYKNLQETHQYDMALATSTFKNWCKNRAAKMEASSGVLWEAERVMINDMYRLGVTMLTHYGMWSRQYDEQLEVIGTEYKFRLPVPDAPGLFIAGKIDGVVEYSDGIYLLEHKTAASFRTTPWTFRSLQCGVYTWAARQIFGDIKGMEYRVWLKKEPEDLIPLKRPHMFSQKKDQKTSYEWAMYQLKAYIEEHDLDAGVVFDENQRLLFDLQDNETFFLRRRITRTPQQLDNVLNTLKYIGAQMADPDCPIFAQPGYHCSWCPMSDPCTLQEFGEDPGLLLSAVYNTREYWEETYADG